MWETANSVPLGSTAKLNEAIDLASFYDSTIACLRRALNFQAVVFWLNCVDSDNGSRALAVLQYPDAEWPSGRWEERSAFPVRLFVEPGQRICHLTDLPDGREDASRGIFKFHMEPIDWQFAATLCFWRGRALFSAISIYRTRQQNDFSDAELSALRDLHGLIEAALKRSMRFEASQSEIARLRWWLSESSVPTMMLDSRLRVRFANQEAKRCVMLWSEGPQAAALNLASRIEAPNAIKEACCGLRDEWEALGQLRRAGAAPECSIVRSGPPALTAKVRFLPVKPPTLQEPGYMVKFARTPDLDPLSPSVSREELLNRLTPAERGVLEQMLAGLSSREISHRLNKTEGTVKLQTSSIFRKLGVDSRVKALLLFR